MTQQQTVLFDAPGPKARKRITIINIVATIGVLGVLYWVLSVLQSQGQLNPRLWLNAINGNAWANYLLPGLQFTLQAAVIAIVTSMIFGLAAGMLRLSSLAFVRAITMAVVEFFRAVPLLVLMIFLYFLYSQLANYGLLDARNAAYFAVITALTLYNGAVISELVRSGVNTLPKGQREAALSIGMTRGRSLVSVEVPQALVAMLPSLVSQFVIILKDSALGYMISFSELLRYARQLGAGYGNILQTLVVAAVVFILVNFLLRWVANTLSKRLSSRTSGETTVDH